MIRKLVIISAILLAFTAAASGDEIDESLPGSTPETLKRNARRMISQGLDPDRVIDLTRTMIQNRFTTDQALKAQEIVMTAQRNGLPPEPIMNKAFEGMTKRVQARQISAAMEKVRERYAYAYRQAAEITGRQARQAHIGNIVAGGLAAGLNERDVEKITRQLKARARTMETTQNETLAAEAFSTARDMARLGVPSHGATDLVHQALKHNYRVREMRRLREIFRNRSRRETSQGLAFRYARPLPTARVLTVWIMIPQKGPVPSVRVVPEAPGATAPLRKVAARANQAIRAAHRIRAVRAAHRVRAIRAAHRARAVRAAHRARTVRAMHRARAVPADRPGQMLPVGAVGAATRAIQEIPAVPAEKGAVNHNSHRVNPHFLPGRLQECTVTGYQIFGSDDYKYKQYHNYHMPENKSGIINSHHRRDVAACRVFHAARRSFRSTGH